MRPLLPLYYLKAWLASSPPPTPVIITQVTWRGLGRGRGHSIIFPSRPYNCVLFWPFPGFYGLNLLEKFKTNTKINLDSNVTFAITNDSDQLMFTKIFLNVCCLKTKGGDPINKCGSHTAFHIWTCLFQESQSHVQLLCQFHLNAHFIFLNSD